MQRMKERIENAILNLKCKEVQTLLKIRTNDGIIYTYETTHRYRNSIETDEEYVMRVNSECIEELLNFEELIARGTPLLLLEELVLMSTQDIGRTWVELGAIYMEKQTPPSIED